jgi:PAS domain S-box-containing protein
VNLDESTADGGGLDATRERDLLIEQLPAALIRFDMNRGVLTYASEQLGELLGMPVESWFGPGALQRFQEGIVEGELPSAGWRERALRGERWTNVLRWRRPDGELLWLRFVTAPMPHDPMHMQSIIQDATAETDARRELEALIEDSPGVLIRYDVDRREILHVTSQIEQLTGEPAANWVGAEGYARWVAAMVEPDTPDWEEVGRSGRSWSNHYGWLRSDGERRWFQSRNRIVGPGIVQSIVFDETGEVELERALMHEQRRYQMLVEQLPATVFRNRPDGTLDYISPQFERHLGYSRDELFDIVNGPEGWSVFHPDDESEARRLSKLLLAGEIASYEQEVRLRTRSGTYRTVLLRRARVVDEDSAPEIHSVAMDVTELRAAQARSREVLAALVGTAEAEQARIATELHDDTVQVLTALLLKVQSLGRTTPGLDELAPLLEHALERTRRLTFELRPQILDQAGLGPALSEVAHNGPWQTTTVDVDLPRLAAPIETLVYRSVRELILNARKHSRASTLIVRGRHAHGVVSVDVEDDGVGFNVDAALDPSRPRMHMGLDTTRERARLAGGRLTIDSQPGAGTRVRLILPIEPAADRSY